MINFKTEIAQYIKNTINIELSIIENAIEIPNDTLHGDYAFPCFKLAKDLKKSPILIANEIKEKIIVDNNIIEKIVITAYL